MVDVDLKIIDVVTSCKTTDQFNCAERYIKLAKKKGVLNRDCYHILVGTISTLKGIILRSKGDNNEDNL